MQRIGDEMTAIKREKSTETDSLGDTPVNPISSLRTINHLRAMMHLEDLYELECPVPV